MELGHATQRARGGSDLGDVYAALFGATRPMLWPAHLVLLAAPHLVPGLGAAAWPIGLLLWLAAGLVASAAHARDTPPALVPLLWTTWRGGLAALGLLVAAATAPWAAAAIALYGAHVLAWTRLHRSDAL